MNIRALPTDPRIILSTLLGAAVLTYIAALYLSFTLNFQLTESVSILLELKEDIAAAEVELRKAEAGLFKEKPKFLNSMVEVGAIKYLAPESVAVSQYEARQ